MVHGLLKIVGAPIGVMEDISMFPIMIRHLLHVLKVLDI